MSYTGISPTLRAEVIKRDAERCRWCGATNRGADLHHVEYRRGYSYDRLDNLISLCRRCHGFVHGTPNGKGEILSKSVAQYVLTQLIERPGTTGLSVWRRVKRQWVLEGRCTQHGERADECQKCGKSSSRAIR